LGTSRPTLHAFPRSRFFFFLFAPTSLLSRTPAGRHFTRKIEFARPWADGPTVPSLFSLCDSPAGRSLSLSFDFWFCLTPHHFRSPALLCTTFFERFTLNQACTSLLRGLGVLDSFFPNLFFHFFFYSPHSSSPSGSRE